MFLLAAVVLGLLTVPLAGGKLRRLAHAELRQVPLVFAALGTQIVVILVLPGDTIWHRILHLGSYGLAAAFVIANRHIAGIFTIGIGALLNLLAITANGGVMPASETALRAAGLLTAADGFANSAAVSDPKLLFLGDIFAIPESWPLHNVFSIGDVLIAVGVVIALHFFCDSRLGLALRRTTDIDPVVTKSAA
jgi:hypothetical protein